jgi:iron(III) transport system substrate-binding protein
MALKGSGEALAQLIAEKDNPKTDVWFGGTGDPHLQAAEQGLTLEYKSPTLPQLHEWAQQQAKQSGYKTVGIYSGPLGFGYNPELLAKKKLPVPKTWADLLKPEYKGEIQVANPASSGTAYTMIATLVQLMGEDKAFDYLKGCTRTSAYTALGHRPDQGGGARRDRGVDQLRARRPRREDAGLPGRDHHAGDGTGAEIGSMSIIKGARNLDAAKKFYEWALTPAAQEMAPRPSSSSCPATRRQGRCACRTSRRSSSSTTTTRSTAPAPSAAA